jgi:EmrB/QacA subfamily drug resistance transporter
VNEPSAALRLGTPAGRGALLATVLGTGMVMLDSTIVNVALPHIGNDLKTDLAGLQWTLNGYTLTLAALILLGGSLGDRFGRRRVFLVGVCWFAVASALCGLAPNIEVLVAARALQGVGGALLTPGSLALIQASFHPDDRPKAIGAWSGLSGVATAVGPLVGGWLIQVADWRYAFWLNLPLAAFVVVWTLRHMPESRDEQAARGFDVGGAVLGAVGLAGLTYALVSAPGRGASVAVLGAAAVGVLGLVGFVLLERRLAAPMMPPGLWLSATFSAVNAVTFFVYGALGGLIFFVVVQLQVVAGFSAIAAGLSMLPLTVLMLTLSAPAGALAQRIGPTWQLTLGPLVAGLGTLLMLRIGPHASYLTDVLPAVLLMGLGMTALVAPLTSTVLSSVESRHAGTASGVNNAVARTGGLLSVAALPLVAGLSGTAYDHPAVFDHGFRTAVVCCAVLFAVAGLVSALFVRRAKVAAPTEAAPAPVAPARPAGPAAVAPAPVARQPEWQVSCDLSFPPCNAGQSTNVDPSPDRPAA